MKSLFAFLLVLASLSIYSQSVTIDGEAIITQMDTDNTLDDVVVRAPDGTLGTRSAQSISSTPSDTTKTLK